MRIELIDIYHEGPYYRVEQGDNVSYAYGKNRKKQLEEYIEKSQEPIHLVNSIGFTHSQRLIEAVEKRNKLLIMIKLRNLLIKLMDVKSQR